MLRTCQATQGSLRQITRCCSLLLKPSTESGPSVEFSSAAACHPSTLVLEQLSGSSNAEAHSRGILGLIHPILCSASDRRSRTVKCLGLAAYSSSAGDRASEALSSSTLLNEAQESAAQASSGAIVSTAIDAINGLHSLTGFPWWGTICLAAIGMRAVMLPLVVQQLRASSATMPLLRQAASASGEKPSLKQTLANFQLLQQQQKTPHPAWIVAAPLVQVPVLITLVMAVRRMALQGWPGFDSGGMLWFQDLTLPALAFDPLSTPFGAFGIALPAITAVALVANVDQAFSRLRSGGAMAWLAPKLKLLMEWTSVPCLVIALQLPHGALVYWLASLTFSLCQSFMLRQLGMTSPQAASLSRAHKQLHGAAPNDGTPSQINDLFLKAAQARAGENLQQASQHVAGILKLQPANARALFAMGQLQAASKRWQRAEQAYIQAAASEEIRHQRARCLFGAGVARSMQDAWEPALESFLAGAEELRTALQAGSGSGQVQPGSNSHGHAVADFKVGSGSVRRRREEQVEEAIDPLLCQTSTSSPTGMGIWDSEFDSTHQGGLAHQAIQRLLVRVLVSAASACKHLDCLEQAVELLSEAADLNPDITTVYLEPLQARLQEQERCIDHSTSSPVKAE